MDIRSQRGSTLLMSVVIVLVMSVIAVGIIRFASREVSGAMAGARHQALVACADAGRRYLMSQFHATGGSPLSLKALDDSLDGGGRTRIVGGHVDQMPLGDASAEQVRLAQVVMLPPGSLRAQPIEYRDITNVILPLGVESQPGYRVVVHCVDNSDGTATGGRQLEVEFGVRFGL